ncbi:MAG: 4-(cytidine 5'-diphospho)-2-C-methyl-D-erythritol kinase [Bacillota bacterium]|nr:MAG: 4-(cytidine 5'-diphospho)-2-C-methyl-D-erythritol kinase [Bacillota bacterium]
MEAGSSRLRLRAFAKVNLSLTILGRRPDGYHEIDSLMHRIAWWDDVELVLLPGGELRLVVESDGEESPPVPNGPENLVLKAARWLRDTFGVRDGAEIRLRKRVATSAGLGGGSADAAVVLRGLRRLWRIPVRLADLRVAAATVGADVPFLLGGRAARVRGIGERIEPLPAWPGLHLVLLPLPRPVPTAWAYAAWDAYTLRRAPNTRPIPQPGAQDALHDLRHDGTPPPACSWEAAAGAPGSRVGVVTGAPATAVLNGFVRSFLARDLDGMARYARNDFEPVVTAHYPEVQRALSDLRAAGAVAARMTGSGPTVWGLYASREEAERAWRHLRQAYPQARLTRTL